MYLQPKDRDCPGEPAFFPQYAVCVISPAFAGFAVSRAVQGTWLTVRSARAVCRVALGQKESPASIDLQDLFFLLSPFGFYSSDPLGARTQDPNIKSVVLYQLS